MIHVIATLTVYSVLVSVEALDQYQYSHLLVSVIGKMHVAKVEA